MSKIRLQKAVPADNQDYRHKRLTLVLEVEGCRVGNIELDGSYLVKDCASASVQIVQKLLMDEELAEEIADSEDVDADDYVSESLQSESPEDIKTAATKGVPSPVTHDWSSTWDIIQIPPYVKQVSFHVSPQDLNPKRAEDLKARFPNVPILTTLALINRATTDVPEPVPSSTNNIAGSKLTVDSSGYTTSGDARDFTIYKVADRIGLKLGKASKLLWHH